MPIACRRPVRGPGCRVAVLALLASLSLCGAAHAQWSWRDSSGGVTYSDTPPPADIRPADILHQPVLAPPSDTTARPGGGGSYSGTGGVAGGNDAAPSGDGDARKPVAAPKSLAEQDADFRKRLADRQKAQQKAEQDEAQSNERAAACNEARSYLQMIESGTRLMRPDAEGNRNFLDDEQRAAETQKAQDAIAKNC